MRCDILADIPINEFGETADTSGPQVRIWIIYGVELSTLDNKVLESTGPRIRNDLVAVLVLLTSVTRIWSIPTPF